METGHAPAQAVQTPAASHRAKTGVAWPSAGPVCLAPALCEVGARPYVCPGQLMSPTQVAQAQRLSWEAFWKVLGW